MILLYLNFQSEKEMVLEYFLLSLLSNVIGDSHNDINFPHKFLLTDTHILRPSQSVSE